MQAELQTMGLTVGEQERAKFQLEAETIAKQNNIVVTEALRQKIDAAGRSYGEMAQAVADARSAWQFANSDTRSRRRRAGRRRHGREDRQGRVQGIRHLGRCATSA
jgi:hypothetical protein